MEQLQAQIDDLQRQLNELKDYSTIPLDVGNAFKARILGATITGSTNASAVLVQAVNEAGSATYNVAKPMTGFINIIIDNTTYKVPFY